MNESAESQSSWQWYAVKLLFESVVSGEPSPEAVDDNYTDEFKMYEESILLIKAQSFDQAFESAEKKAKEAEHSYRNPYDQLIDYRLIRPLDAFCLSGEEPQSGTELYSRWVHAPKELDAEEVIEGLYPETTLSDEEEMHLNWIYRDKEHDIYSEDESGDG